MTNFTHPTHGPLTIGPKLPGTRTYVCTTTEGTEVRLSSREINKHTKAPPPPPNLLEYVRTCLDAIPDDIGRVQVAKEIWHLADQYVEERV